MPARSHDEDLSKQIADFRPLMYRLAFLQLRDAAAAEDVTQDALLAALDARHTFEGRSALRTWVVSILRFKILDALRDRVRGGRLFEQRPSSAVDAVGTTANRFDSAGRWATVNVDWTNPSTQLQRAEFSSVLSACMEKLPPHLSRVFLMREWLDLSSSEICTRLQISAGNLRILLHRARLRLRDCLDRNWGRQP